MQLDPVDRTALVERIRQLPEAARYTPEDLMTEDFLVAWENDTVVYYAPFDWVNASALLAVIGITPGWGQMQESFQAFKRALDDGLSIDQALEAAKKHASFAGSMRRNLLSMLTDLGLPSLLGIEDATALFFGRSDLVHSTSAIRYPVFVNGANYSGHRPIVSKSPMLRSFVVNVLRSELTQVESALVVPLGGAVESALQILIDRGELDEDRVMFGFPHPSGSNGHRRRQFAQGKEALQEKAWLWFRTTSP